MTGPIVVGIDGREPTDVLEFCAELAGGMRTALVLVHVAGTPLAFPYGDARLQELMRRGAVAEGTALLTEVGGPVQRMVGETRVEFGTPAEALRRVAYELHASLIVVCPRERRGLTRVLWRGTTGTIAAESPCPVVVVPERQHAA
jgi:nucleotide-binding universal stress UspA family protein